jgi:arabinogalactan endo-1,4-beta-galactosidase
MSVSMDNDDFVEYVKTLKFQQLDDLVEFSDSYYNFYKNLLEKNGDPEAIANAAHKYSIIMTAFGKYFIENCRDYIAIMETIEKTIKNIEPR